MHQSCIKDNLPNLEIYLSASTGCIILNFVNLIIQADRCYTCYYSWIPHVHIDNS